MNTFDVILHPTDFSTDSDQAFQLACGVARDQFAELVVVHVLAPSSCPDCDSDADLLQRRSSGCPQLSRAVSTHETARGRHSAFISRCPGIRGGDDPECRSAGKGRSDCDRFAPTQPVSTSTTRQHCRRCPEAGALPRSLPETTNSASDAYPLATDRGTNE